MRKTLSLMALLGSGVATCVFAALPVITGERGNRAAEGDRSPGNVHPEMVYSTDGGSLSRPARTDRNSTIRRAGAPALGSIDLRGSAINLSAWGDDKAYGLYNIPYSSGADFSMIFPADASVGCGYDNGDGLFYGFSRTVKSGMYVYNINHYDIESGEIVATVEADYDLQASDIAVDPTTGKAYGCCPGSSGEYIWAQLDYATAQRTDLGSTPVMLSGIGADRNGQFYAVGRNGYFYKVDKTDGSLSEIGDTGLSLQYLTGGCYNDSDNTFLMAYSTDSSAGLAEIDVTTGHAVVVKEFAPKDDITCLYIPAPAAEDKAPAMPALEITSEGGSMDVRMSLTMPTTLFDGTSAQGTAMGYRIYADGELLKEGNSTAGATVVENTTMQSTGKVKFTAVCSNSVGDSPKAKVTYYVGFGTPESPANVCLVWNDNTATLSWDAVDASADGGYLNPADVSYTVYDEKDAVLASDLKTTSYSIPLAQGTSYYTAAYKVAAVNSGVTSAPAMSNRVGVGSYNAPYKMSFNNQKDFDLNTVYDGNPSEGKTWRWDYMKKSAAIYFHPNENMNDWLFSPNIRLEGGSVYVLNATVHAQSTLKPERIAISYGMGANVAAMTEELLPPTDVTVNDASPMILRLILRPAVTGLYNIGFHAVSDPNSAILYVPSYDIEAARRPTVPEAVTDTEIIPDPQGLPTATVSCRLPRKSIGGPDLTGRVKVDVLRGATKIGTLEGNPGEVKSLDDNVGASGEYEYTFVPFNSQNEEGLRTVVSSYIGAYPPAPATGRIGYNEGNTVNLFWNAVTTDINGSPIMADNMTYNVFTVVGDEVGQKINEQPITDSNFEFEINAPLQQTSVQYAIQPVHRDMPGITSGVIVAVGPAYDMPKFYGEAAEGMNGNMITSGDAEFPIGNTGNLIKPYAGSEYFVISYRYVGAAAAYITGKVHVSGENPVFSFMAYRNGTADLNQASVSVMCEGEQTELAVFDYENLVPGEWNLCKVPLDEYADRNVQIRLTGICLCDETYSYFDDMKFTNDLDYDIEARSISAIDLVDNGMPFDINVSVANAASKNSGKFNVILYRDGEQVDVREVADLSRDERKNIVFSQTLTPADAEEVDFRAVVDYDRDEKTGNNATETVTVMRRISQMPTVTGLSGERMAGEDRLGWTAYDPASVSPEEVTEDFESGNSFSHSFTGWSFYDIDASPVGSFGNYSVPGIESGVTLASFFVFDTAAGSYNASFDAHSGTKYLAGLYRADFEEVDDWVISPELPGMAQTISFWAKPYNPNYPEKIEVWYSLGGNNPVEFVKCEEFGTKVLDKFVDGRSPWEEFSADLPEGTRYFAIRSCAEDNFMVMIDDITCTRVPVVTGSLLGYNIYCNGRKVNGTPVADAAFATAHDGDDRTYNVSQVFANGESELSDGCTLKGADVKGIMADGLGIKAAAGHIRVTGTEGRTVTVTTVDGILIHRGAGDVDLTVLPAVYIVDVNGKAVKVVVR